MLFLKSFLDEGFSLVEDKYRSPNASQFTGGLLLVLKTSRSLFQIFR